jgi:hypothetical protein
MLLKGVIIELKALLGKIGPQLTVHAGVYRLTIAISTGSPCMVPLPTFCILLFNANYLIVLNKLNVLQSFEG